MKRTFGPSLQPCGSKVLVGDRIRRRQGPITCFNMRARVTEALEQALLGPSGKSGYVADGNYAADCTNACLHETS